MGFDEIQTDAVQASEIQDNSIDSGEIVDNSLFESDLASGSVTSSELGSIADVQAVSSAIAPGAVGSVSVQCNAGERIISGGNDASFSEVVVASRFQSPNGWAVFAEEQQW